MGDSSNKDLSKEYLATLIGRRPHRLWLINAVLISIVAFWAFYDPLFEWAIYGSDILSLFHYFDDSDLDWNSIIANVDLRRTVLGLLGLFFLVTNALLMAELWRGPKQFRSLKSLLMLVTFACLWIGLAMSLSNITWYGKQMRVGRMLASFEPIAAELRAEWPANDGELSTLGPYKSYPLDRPTTLMLLVSPELPESGARLTLVERAESGALRFMLSGSEIGDWVEWHPAGSEPQSFHNGLYGSHELSRSAEFGDGWYLVRYE